MWRDLLRAIALIAVGGLLAACDTVRDETISIDYVPLANPVVVRGAESVSLSVVAVDKRTGLKDRISNKRGIASAVVYAGNDVIDVARRAVESEFKAQGFVVGSGGFTVTVEVLNFYNDFRPNPWFISSIADVALTLRVKDANGIVVYTHAYDGVAQLSAALNELGETAKAALQQALASVVSQIDEDIALQASLLGKSGRSSRGRTS